jgi:hypothetical protein
MRSPGTDHECILRNTEMLSTPELVRVSLITTRPLSSIIPTQYVIFIPGASAEAAYCSTRCCCTAS